MNECHEHPSTTGSSLAQRATMCRSSDPPVDKNHSWNEGTPGAIHRASESPATSMPCCILFTKKIVYKLATNLRSSTTILILPHPSTCIVFFATTTTTSYIIHLCRPHLYQGTILLHKYKGARDGVSVLRVQIHCLSILRHNETIAALVLVCPLGIAVVDHVVWLQLDSVQAVVLDAGFPVVMSRFTEKVQIHGMAPCHAGQRIPTTARRRPTIRAAKASTAFCSIR